MKLPYVLLSGSWYVINKQKGIATIKEYVWLFKFMKQTTKVERQPLLSL